MLRASFYALGLPATRVSTRPIYLCKSDGQGGPSLSAMWREQLVQINANHDQGQAYNESEGRLSKQMGPMCSCRTKNAAILLLNKEQHTGRLLNTS
jgi:hypothetical protein